MERISERGAFEGEPAKDLRDERRERAIVQRRADKVGSLSWVCDTVPACFENVDLPRDRPGAVKLVFGQHPYGRPEPVAVMIVSF